MTSPGSSARANTAIGLSLIGFFVMSVATNAVMAEVRRRRGAFILNVKRRNLIF